MTSLYETIVFNQLEEWKRLLKSPLPSAIYTINPTKRRIIFVGTNPDTVRSDQYPYKHARDHLTL